MAHEGTCQVFFSPKRIFFSMHLFKENKSNNNNNFTLITPSFPMNRYAILGFIVGILTAAFLLSSAKSQQKYGPHKVYTLKNPSEVERLISSKEQVFILFHASWCHHCKTLKPMFEALNDDFDSAIFAHVECSSNPTIPQKHGITAFPCIRKYEGGAQTGEMMGARPTLEATKDALEKL